MTASIDQQRRRLLVGSLGVSLGLLCSPQTLWAEVAKQSLTPSSTTALLNTLCELVIPATDTPGAHQVGVAQFVEFAAKHGLRGANQHIVADFERALNTFARATFTDLAPEQQVQLLEQVDQHVFSRNSNLKLSPELASWKPIKALIVVGYYTSEVGGSEELRYQLIPGTFVPDMPLTEDSRAWSSDWTGVKYG